VYSNPFTPVSQEMKARLARFDVSDMDVRRHPVETAEKASTLLTGYVMYPLQVGTTAEALGYPENGKCVVVFAPKGNIATIRDVVVSLLDKERLRVDQVAEMTKVASQLRSKGKDERRAREAEDFIQRHLTDKLLQIIVVTREPLTTQSKAYTAKPVNGVPIDCFLLRNLQGNIAEHRLQRPHVPLNAACCAALRERYKDAIFPALRGAKEALDPMVHFMGFPIGTLVAVQEAGGLAQAVTTYWEVRET
jgi:hypothetical protein